MKSTSTKLFWARAFEDNDCNCIGKQRLAYQARETDVPRYQQQRLISHRLHDRTLRRTYLKPN